MQTNDWQAIQRQIRVEAIEIIATTPRIEEIRATIWNAFRLLSEQTLNASDAKLTVEYVAQQLQNLGAAEWASALIESSSPLVGMKSSNLIAVEITIGHVAGIFFGNNPGERELAFARHIRNLIHFSSQDFLDFSEPIIAGNESAKSKLFVTLHQRVINYEINPEGMASISRRGAEILRNRIPGTQQFMDVWREPYLSGLVTIHDTLAYELLRRVDYQQYLNLLDALPISEMVYDILREANESASVSDLCALLRDAHPAFDDDIQWRKGKYAVFYILQHLNNRLFAEISDDGSLNQRFESYLAEILSAMTSRADYVPLGYSWMQHLVPFGQKRRRASDIHEVNTKAALTKIAMATAATLSSLADPVKWIAEELNVWRCERVYALLAIELSRSAVNDQLIIEIIEQVILQGLVMPINMERLQERRDGFEWCVLSSAISRIPHPSVWFQELWGKMYWLRNQARGNRRSSNDSAKSAQAIILWSIAGMAGLDPASDKARALWSALESAARESYFTEANREHGDLWLPILRLLGAFLPITFPEDPAKGEQGSLDNFLSRWHGVTRDFAFLLLTLHQCGITAERLASAGITAELLNLIAEDSKILNHSLLTAEQSTCINDLAVEIAMYP